MSIQKTIGGDRLGSGKKMKVNLHGYERSTHDLSYIWRSTMAAGTLVPFMKQLALPGDTLDIDLNCEIMTHPTIGPLFGSYKVQLDIFQAPIRLYNSLLHNNALNIGLHMDRVKFPILELTALDFEDPIGDVDNTQINPSCILAYLGIRGIGDTDSTGPRIRAFNAIPLLAYWDIYKNYYANKQEEVGYVIHTPALTPITTVTTIDMIDALGNPVSVPQAPATNPQFLLQDYSLEINYTIQAPRPSDIMIMTEDFGPQTAEDLFGPFTDSGTTLSGAYKFAQWGSTRISQWYYRTPTDIGTAKPALANFPLSNLDDMRKKLLSFSSETVAFNVLQDGNEQPYNWVQQHANDIPNSLSSQEGLGIKTYQSDLFNNWLNTEWIDGTGGINEITAIDVSGGTLQMDALLLARKVYDMLNRIAISGGTYNDWLDTVYDNERYRQCETPMYMGGLIKELVFQEVVSNSQSTDQPLGTLAGKGTLSKKHKGGHVVVKVDEPSYILGIISLTPRIDYSQGNDWDTHLATMDDLHKPALDEIGFQEDIVEQRAWWDTLWDGTKWVQKSAGKQPAWLNYMTNVNQVRGNFAIANNEMFMTLNRRYEYSGALTDLTTYIDPSKFNHIFAETQLDAQNFWSQIGINITARRKMSAKIMPNL